MSEETKSIYQDSDPTWLTEITRPTPRSLQPKIARASTVVFLTLAVAVGATVPRTSLSFDGAVTQVQRSETREGSQSSLWAAEVERRAKVVTALFHRLPPEEDGEDPDYGF